MNRNMKLELRKKTQVFTMMEVGTGTLAWSWLYYMMYTFGALVPAWTSVLTAIGEYQYVSGLNLELLAAD